MNIFKPNIEKLKSKRDIKGLINALHDDQELSTSIGSFTIKQKICDLASEALIEFKDSNAVPDLIRIVEQAPDVYSLAGSESKKSKVAEKAIEILGKIGDNRAIPVLIQSLPKKFNLFGQHPAVEALSNLLDKKSIPRLLNLLKNGEKSVQLEICNLLGKMPSKESVPILLELLDDPALCSTAVCSLADIGAARSVPKLVEKAKSADISTRRLIYAALIVLKEKKGLAKSLACETLTGDLANGLRQQSHGFALHYLCTLNDPSVVDYLISSIPALTKDFIWTSDMEIGGSIPNSYNWESPLEDCLGAIAKLGGKNYIPKLEELLKKLEQDARQYVESDRDTREIRASLSRTIESLKKK